MGMYTELIFGVELKKDTPSEVIDLLKYLIDNESTFNEKFKGLPFVNNSPLNGGSGYFGVNESVSKLWQDEHFKTWHISTRANLKDYKHEITTFLKWVKPYIGRGSGNRDMYAIVTYEEAETPEIYYK